MGTIPELNERAHAALAERLGDPSRRLHGILATHSEPGSTQVLWPYGEVLIALQAAEGSRCDDDFYKGSVPLHEFLRIFLRSCQLLGLSLRRLEQKMEDDRRDHEAHSGESRWEVEIDLEAPYGYSHTSTDVCIHVDSCVAYLKILADCVAKTLPSVFENPPFRVSRESINRLWNDALQKRDGAIRDLFSRTSRDWLNILSAPRDQVAGIRDARFHWGASILPIGSWQGNDPVQVVIKQGSVGRESAGSRPGETIRSGILHSGDMISDLSTSVRGFFSFLDHVVRVAVDRDPALSPIRESYSKSGYARAFGPSDFLESVLPTV